VPSLDASTITTSWPSISTAPTTIPSTTSTAALDPTTSVNAVASVDDTTTCVANGLPAVPRDVTAAEWGRGFPDQGWVNGEALRLLDGDKES